MLIDTHCHLTDIPLNSDISGVIARAYEVGVAAFVCPSADRESSCDAVEVAKQWPGKAFAAVGIHPAWIPASVDTTNVQAYIKQELGWLEELISKGNVTAIGEIGLDKAVVPANVEVQKAVFLAQAQLAKDAGLAIIVHVRKAFSETLQVLKSLGKHLGVAHAFGGSTELSNELFKLGYYRGVGGTITRPGSVRIRAAVKATSLETIVLETDAPYIGTESVPAGRVQPCDLPEIAVALAKLHDCSIAKVIEQTTNNAMQLFDLELERAS